MNKAGLEQWKHYRSLANNVCNWVLESLQQDSEVRIWPHHFDTGIYVTPNEHVGLGFGLAVAETMVNASYFYFSGYGLKDKLDFSSVPSLEFGEWKVGDGYKGAVLPITLFEGLSNEKMEEILSDFLIANINWLLK